MKIILENWINGEDRFGLDGSSRIRLSDKSQIYGIRRYLRGASLNLHVDRPTTHIISAILQLDQVKFNQCSEIL